jgi:PTS system galactitol-specific IIA component
MSEAVSLESLLHPELTFFDFEADSRDDLIRKMAEEAIDAGYATGGYADDVIEREDLYPTGLPTEVMKVAVPHAMVQDHVKSAAIVIARLAHPIDFKEMGDGVNDVPVDMVFMLVAKGDKDHLAVLQRLICVFAIPDFMTQLKATRTPEELIELLPKLAARAL